jgi:hypothetical protein
VFPTLDHRLARILAYLGVSGGPSSLEELVEGLAGVDDGLNRRRRRKKQAGWRNLSHELLDKLCQILFGVGKAQKKRKKVFQLEKKRFLMEQAQEKVQARGKALVELLLGLILMKPHC